MSHHGEHGDSRRTKRLSNRCGGNTLLISTARPVYILFITVGAASSRDNRDTMPLPQLRSLIKIKEAAQQ